jgi:hypothetical protein
MRRPAFQACRRRDAGNKCRSRSGAFRAGLDGDGADFGLSSTMALSTLTLREVDVLATLARYRWNAVSASA